MHDEKPSRTALKVALNVLALGAKPEAADLLPPGIVDATAALLIASGVAGRRTVRLVRTRGMARIYNAFDWMLPGQFDAFAHRKAFCERQVRKGIAAGASQVLILGAGYDTMGWRLAPEYPTVDFFEIDHPATASLKAKGIGEMGPRPNLHLVSVDLANRRLAEVLGSVEGWNLSAATTIVAEGLLPYLAPEAARDLFVQCASVVGDGRMAFTYIPSREDGTPDAGPRSGLVMWLLKLGSEPWLWSIRPEELPDFLEAAGWAHAPGLQEAAGKHGLEFYVVAEKSGGSETEPGPGPGMV